MLINTTVGFFFSCEKSGRLVHIGDEHRSVSDPSFKMSVMCVHFLNKNYVPENTL
jgi:hypothetical protein